jgi:hypothetical protein
MKLFGAGRPIMSASAMESDWEILERREQPKALIRLQFGAPE